MQIAEFGGSEHRFGEIQFSFGKPFAILESAFQERRPAADVTIDSTKLPNRSPELCRSLQAFRVQFLVAMSHRWRRGRSEKLSELGYVCLRNR